MGRIFFGISALLFLVDALGATWLPHQISIGMFCLAFGLVLSGVPMIPWRAKAP